MLKRLMHKYALSRQGAIDLIKGILACALQNISLMFPISLLYLFVSDLLSDTMPSTKLWLYIGGIVFSLLFVFIVTYFQYNATYLLTYKESGVRRITLAETLRKLPLSVFGRRDLADLTTVIMGDCAFLETISSHYVSALYGSIISSILIALSLFIFNWKMALAVLWVLPVSFGIVLLTKRVQKKIKQKADKVNLICADGVQECIETSQDIKANNAEKMYLKGLFKKIDDVEKITIKNEFATASFVGIAQMILKLGIATVALVGSALLISGEIDVLMFFMFLLVASRIYDPLQGSLNSLSAIIVSGTNVARMNEILEHDVQNGVDKLSNNGYDIEFKNVGFAYNKGEDVLKDVSFKANQGEVTALVGPSGGGKTTVSSLASRFWDINNGKITVGGMDISQIEPETLLSLYSIVFQNVTLFNNSIMENIRIGRKTATDEEVLRAAKLANCDEFALKLPNGYNTSIGENGSDLSGGERQRISIARAFLKDAPIVLLDEATASLDVENETKIQTALSRLIKNKTVLIIAHRMRTVANADKIIVLSNGCVAEQGTPKELLMQNGIFAHMVELQTQSQNWKL